jgi:hypothetical protein
LNKDKHVIPQYYNQGTRNEKFYMPDFLWDLVRYYNNILVENSYYCCREIERTEHFLLYTSQKYLHTKFTCTFWRGSIFLESKKSLDSSPYRNYSIFNLIIHFLWMFHLSCGRLQTRVMNVTSYTLWREVHCDVI